MKIIQDDKGFHDILPSSLIELCKIFEDNDKELFVVGGSIRDFFMGKEPKDFDVCTASTPDEVLDLLQQNGIKSTFHGQSFGVVVAYTSDCPMGIEIATFRKDIYTEDTLGITRNCDVEYTSIEHDAERRDLTINSIYYNITTKEFYDFNGGLEDIANGIIKMVGNPSDRITEDKLRALRAIRFAAKTGYTIEPKTIKAIKSCNLDNISMERIWSTARRETVINEKDGEIINAFKHGNVSHLIFLLNTTYMYKHIFCGKATNRAPISNFKYITTFIDMYVPNLEPKKMVQMLKIDSKTARKIEILRLVKNFKLNNLISIKRKLLQHNISKEEAIEFCGDTDIVDKIFRLELMDSMETQNLINQGFMGVDLGTKIFEIEARKFAEL
jgi:hypothetical protein